jgi:peptide/nickel transport system substrate-binding protein
LPRHPKASEGELRAALPDPPSAAGCRANLRSALKLSLPTADPGRVRTSSGRLARALGLAAAIACALALAACGSGSGSSSGDTSSGDGGNEGGTLKATFSSFPEALDPALSLTAEAENATYDTYIPLLTYKHASGKAGSQVVPGLAAAMPKVSDGGRTYEMTLAKGLRYSNGEAVKASDFTHGIERLFLLNSPGSPFFEDIEGAEEFAKTKKGGIPGIEADDKTGRITIHLAAPRGTFENELALPLAAPVPAKTPAEDMTAEPPPATGPYEIVDAKVGRGWEYERNPQWAKANAKLVPNVPAGHVDKIVVSVIRNGSTQVNDVEQGTQDWMFNPPPADRYAAVKEKYEGTQFKVEPTVNTFFFWLNTELAPFDDLEVRQAVNYAIDPRALERIYAGQLTGAQQMLPPGMPGYEKLDLYPHSMAKAKELIAAAAPSQKSVDVWMNTESPNNEAVEYLGGVLEELGFDVTLKTVNSDNYFTVIGNGSTPNLNAGFASWFQDYPHPSDFFGPLLSEAAISPSEASNLPRWRDPAWNATLEKLGEEALGPQQEAAYAQLDREMMEQAPIAPYGNSTVPTFVSDDVDLEKVIFNPTFSQDLTSFQLK